MNKIQKLLRAALVTESLSRRRIDEEKVKARLPEYIRDLPYIDEELKRLRKTVFYERRKSKY